MLTCQPSQIFRNFPPVWPWSRSRTLIGLDIGEQAISFVRLQNRMKNPQVIRWGIEYFAPHIINQGRIANKSVLSTSLRGFVEKFGLKGSSVAMAVNGASVIVKRVQVPRRYQHNLEEYLLWEGGQYIPYDPEEVYFDFSLCSSKIPMVDNDDIDLLLVVSKRDAVDERRGLLEEAGLCPVICDVEALAFLNMTSMNKEVQSHSSYLVANLQGRMMNVVVMVKGEPLFVRDVSFSTIAPPTSADRNPKESYQPPEADIDHVSHGVGVSLSEKVVCFEIVSELKRTVEGAREILPDLDIKKVFLYSRHGVGLEVQEELRHTLCVPVSLVDPVSSFVFGGHKETSQQIAPFPGVAGGLALRAPCG